MNRIFSLFLIEKHGHDGCFSSEFGSSRAHRTEVPFEGAIIVSTGHWKQPNMKCGRTWFSIALALAVLMLGSSLPANAASRRWVGTWMAPIQLTEPGNMPPAPGLSDSTLREIVHVTLGGSKIRVRFTNEFGTEPLILIAVHVAVPADTPAATPVVVPGTPGAVLPAIGNGAIKPNTDKALTFNGSDSVTIPVGTVVYSDPIDFHLVPYSDVALTVYVKDSSKHVTGHPSSRTTSFLVTGNKVADETLPDAVKFEHWYYASGIEVETKNNTASVVTLGDSITDGRGSIINGNTRWPDFLAKRFHANKKTSNISVLNAGIGGNAVLAGGLGPTALSRLDRDVLNQAGVKWVIVFEGVNDIGGRTPTLDQFITGFKKIIDRSHARGLRVYGATITPLGFYYTKDKEQVRSDLNNWIRTSGAYDGVFDFDAAVRDPANPTKLRAESDSGDGLHLNTVGYELLANAVDLSLFQGK
jgi:lysophospholipase L1-like esterase